MTSKSVDKGVFFLVEPIFYYSSYFANVFLRNSKKCKKKNYCDLATKRKKFFAVVWYKLRFINENGVQYRNFGWRRVLEFKGKQNWTSRCQTIATSPVDMQEFETFGRFLIKATTLILLWLNSLLSFISQINVIKVPRI